MIQHIKLEETIVVLFIREVLYTNDTKLCNVTL